MSTYRRHLRRVVAASAAPYGYTLTLWTAGAVTTHADGVPSAWDAVLLLTGAVLAFAAVGAFAFEGINGVLAPEASGDVRVWGGVHLPSVGTSIALVWLVTRLVTGHLVWPAVGFVATATYLLMIGVQFWLATQRAAADHRTVPTSGRGRHAGTSSRGGSRPAAPGRPRCRGIATRPTGPRHDRLRRWSSGQRWSGGRPTVRALATVISLVVLAGVGTAGYVLVSGAHASAPASYWCTTALDRADDLDRLDQALAKVQVSALKAKHRHQAGRYHRKLAKVRNLEARASHARDAYRSAAARCRDAR